jgi:hypothetical protein
LICAIGAGGVSSMRMTVYGLPGQAELVAVAFDVGLQLGHGN